MASAADSHFFSPLIPLCCATAITENESLVFSHLMCFLFSGNLLCCTKWNLNPFLCSIEIKKICIKAESVTKVQHNFAKKHGLKNGISQRTIHTIIKSFEDGGTVLPLFLHSGRLPSATDDLKCRKVKENVKRSPNRSLQASSSWKWPNH